MKRPHSPSLAILKEKRISTKHRDENGFRLRQQDQDKHKSDSSAVGRTIHEDEVEGARYVLDGPFRRVTPYFFTYITYCKLRWRNRKLIDVFTDEFRDRPAAVYAEKIAAGEVMLNRQPANLESVIKNGDEIRHRTHRHEPPVTSRQIDIVHEDSLIIVIDKPSGIPVHPTGRYRYNTVTKIFQHEFGQTVHPCNRLDRLTLGLMFLAKTGAGADRMVQLIKSGAVRKEYIAKVRGEFSTSDVTVDQPLYSVSPKHLLNIVDERGKPSVTKFRRILYDPHSNTSVVRCFPQTGRTHQIRVHLRHIGHPIANDPVYLSEYVWGPSLGQELDQKGVDEVIARLDAIGKTRGCSLWIHPQEDGEFLTGELCPECGTELYSDPGPNDLDLWLHAFRYSCDEWLYQTAFPRWAVPKEDYMKLALEQARKCGETQTQFNVGAVLVHNNRVIATGHLRELEGNTHAEQCALEKYAAEHGCGVPAGTELYTTMEPCSLRLSGNLPCVDRILGSQIKTCYVGVVEPDTFVKNNVGKAKLEDAGVHYIHIGGYEEECLRVATLGHEKRDAQETEQFKEEKGDSRETE